MMWEEVEHGFGGQSGHPVQHNWMEKMHPFLNI